jgi:diguanylate cyclase (GGDEF)-like protein
MWHSLSKGSRGPNGKRMRANIRAEDALARLGGDEFVVLLDQLSGQDQASAIAHRLLEAIESPFLLCGHECRISCSIGIAIFPDDASTMWRC